MVVETLPVTSLRNNFSHPAKISTSHLTSTVMKIHSP